MAVSSTPIFAQTPYILSTSFAAVTACTTRAPTATASLAAANIIQICPTSTNGLRVDYITLNACSSAITAATAANCFGVWIWDGTTATLLNEIVVPVVTPSATVAAYTATYVYSNPLILPAAFRLYGSLGVTTTASTTALQCTVFGGLY